MYALLESSLKPIGKLFNKLLGKVTPMPRPALLEIVLQVRARDLGNVDGIAPEIEEMARNQSKSTVLNDLITLCVNPFSFVSSTILSERYLLIDSHGVDQLAMPGANPEIGPARSGYPITLFSKLDDVGLLSAVLALRQ
jgi:hypothetical protein